MDDEEFDVNIKSKPISTRTIQVVGKERSDKLIAAAEQRGYERALDDVMDTFMTDAYDEPKLQARYKVMIDQLKSAHGGQENGKSI